MSGAPPATATSSASNFVSIFEAASKEYKKLTGQDLNMHPFSVVFDSCDSADAVLSIFRKQAQIFDEIRKGDDRVIKWLDPMVHILFTFSAALGEGVGLVFSPAKVIFAGVGMLLTVAKDVMASYDTLADLFERMQGFLQRLEIYIGTLLTPAMTEVLGRIMAEVLSIFALVTKEMKQGRFKKSLKRLMGRRDVESALQRLDVLTQRELQMVVARNLEVTYGIDGTVKAIEAITSDVNVNVRAIREETGTLSRGRVRSDLRKWISPPNPSVNHNLACDTHHNGTTSWFAQNHAFDEWKKYGSLLWIRGNPGSGKSVLCSTIIEDLKRTAGPSLMIYFYFDFKDAAKRDIRGLLSSLLIQLSDTSDICWGVLSDLYAKHRDGSDQPSEATLVQCLKDMLQSVAHTRFYIIVDALDECPSTTGSPSPREKVLNFVEDLVGCQYPNLYLCITSRTEQDIRTVLDPLTPPSRRVSLHEEFGQREDINTYVRSFVDTDRAMRRWRAEEKQLVIDTLSERADGMFRWVFCQLDTLRRCMAGSIRQALNGLPASLDETYERMLQGIPVQKREHAHRLFQCLIASSRPLKIQELAEIFAIQFDSNVATKLEEGWRPGDAEDAVLSACSSLVSVVKVGDSQIVQFSHFSVKEFLTSDRLATSTAPNICHFHTPLESAHTILAQACLTVLLQLDEKVDKRRIEGLPLAIYAARHWAEHARFKDIELQIQDRIELLFDPTKPHFAAWTWIYDGGKGDGLSVTDLAEHPSPPRATPLYYAALHGLSWTTKQLVVARREDIDIGDSGYGTPMCAALNMGHLEVARLLLEHGADVDGKDLWGDTPLNAFSWGDHVEVMRLLLDFGADANVCDSDGWIPLDGAAAGGHYEVARMLLQHNANVNAKGRMDNTPLHYASQKGDVEVVRLLIEHGADINAQDNFLETPLHNAAREGKLEVVESLLEHGADVRNKSKGGTTAFQLASNRGSSEIAQLLSAPISIMGWIEKGGKKKQ